MNGTHERYDFSRSVRACLEEWSDLKPAAMLGKLVDEGLAKLPQPGAGQTLERWRCLAAVAEHDLALAKLYEGHTDALAILTEMKRDELVTDASRWGVWAADPPSARPQLSAHRDDTNKVYLSGCKAWCSGAANLTHALVTGWSADEGPFLLALSLDQPGVTVTKEGWNAVGMADSGSVEVQFDHAEVCVLGANRSYLERPGFWHGGAGIAACWYGGAVGLSRALIERVRSGTQDLLIDAHLGAVDIALQQTAALLRQTAAAIDRGESSDAKSLALRCRASAESAVNEVLWHVGRALGAAPFCRDRHFARLAADLPVFVRQSHAEHDLAALAQSISAQTSAPWIL